MLCSSTKFCSWHAAYLVFVPVGLWSTAFKDEQFLSRYLQTLSEPDCSMTSTLGWLLLVWGSAVSMNTLAFLLLSSELDTSTQFCGSSSIAVPVTLLKQKRIPFSCKHWKFANKVSGQCSFVSQIKKKESLTTPDFNSDLFSMLK